MISVALRVANSYLVDPARWMTNITWRCPRTVSDLSVVFVMGAPRSGTTLVQRILSVHSEFFGMEDETGLFSKASYFSSNHFKLPANEWRQLQNESVDVVDYFQRSVRHLVGSNSHRTFVEKTPQHVLRIRFILRYFPTARVVHMVRDGRDCFCSARSVGLIPQGRSAGQFAQYWKQCVAAGLAEESNPRVRRLTYEALTTNPTEQIEALMTWLGKTVEPQQLDAACIGADPRSAVPAFARLKEEIGPGSLGRWVDELSPREKVTFQRIAGNELRALGYAEHGESAASFLGAR
jgi:hypothetical protein